MHILQFHSKAKQLSLQDSQMYGLPRDAGKLLSNFAPTPVSWRGHRYPTAEHAFQGAKYWLATNFPAMEKNFREGGQIGMDPAVAKKTGSKGWMKEQTIVLDVAKWNTVSLAVMKEIIRDIQDILRSCHAHGVRLIHFSRWDNMWGAHVNSDGSIKKGDNRLGNIYNEFAKELGG